MSFRVAVVGAGRMGKLHARVLSEMKDAELVCVVDINPAAAEAVAKQRKCKALGDVALAVGMVDAAVIATPTLRHIESAWPFVEAGKAVLIEKPFTDDIPAGQDLIALAEKTGASVQVGHAERFNPVVTAIKKYAIAPKFIEAHRISPFTFRSADVGVVLDMMIHDIDLVLMMAGGKVRDIQAVGVNVIGASRGHLQCAADLRQRLRRQPHRQPACHQDRAEDANLLRGGLPVGGLRQEGGNRHKKEREPRPDPDGPRHGRGGLIRACQQRGLHKAHQG